MNLEEFDDAIAAPSFPHEYWKRSRKILVIGSSISIQKEGYLPSLLAKMKLSGFPHSVLNASLGGSTTDSCLAYIAGNLFYDWRGYQPDLAIIEKGPNERIFSYHMLPSPERQRLISELYQKTHRLIVYLQQQGIPCIILNSYHSATDDFTCDGAHEHGYVVRCYSDLSKQLNVPLIDFGSHLYNETVSGHVNAAQLLLDDCHLNGAGAEIMSSFVFQQLFQLCPTCSLTSAGIGSIGGVSSSLKGLKVPVVVAPPPQQVYSSSLMSTSYFEVEECHSLTLALPCGESLVCVGLFVVSDSASGWIKLQCSALDCGSIDVCLFNHMSFFSIVKYISFSTPLQCKDSVTIQALDAKVDTEIAITAYHENKTFDTRAEWAVNKFLTPLLNRKEGLNRSSAKIIALVFVEAS